MPDAEEEDEEAVEERGAGWDVSEPLDGAAEKDVDEEPPRRRSTKCRVDSFCML